MAALKGGDWSSRVSRTPDGIALQPLYPPAPGPAISARPAGAPWDIMAIVDHTDAGAGNRQILRDLEGGASGLAIAFAHAPSAGGFGLPASEDTLRPLLQDVYLDLVHLRIEPHPRARRLAHWIAGAQSRVTASWTTSIVPTVNPAAQYIRYCSHMRLKRVSKPSFSMSGQAAWNRRSQIRRVRA